MPGNYVKTRKFILTGANLIRLILLLSTLFAFSSYWIWNNRNAWVKKIDDLLLSRYTTHYSSELERGRTLLNTNKTDEGVRVLEDSIHAMRDIRKQDRLALTYQRTVDLLIQVNTRHGNNERALKLSRSLVDFDSNNYKHWLLYAKQLSNNNRSKESIEAFYKSYEIAPHSFSVVEPLAINLINRGQIAEAKEVVEGYLTSNRTGTFQTFWSFSGQNFSSERVATIEDLNMSLQQLSFKIPINKENVWRLRLDFPGLTFLSLKIASLSVVSSEGKVEIDLEKILLRSNDLSRTGTRDFLITGIDPFLHFTLPKELLNTELLAIELEATFIPKLSPNLRNMLYTNVPDHETKAPYEKK